MPTGAILAYMERLPRHQARMSIRLNEVVNLPWLEEGNRKRVVKQWQAAAEYEEETKKASPPAMLRLMGIAVEIVRE